MGFGLPPPTPSCRVSSDHGPATTRRASNSSCRRRWARRARLRSRALPVGIARPISSSARLRPAASMRLIGATGPCSGACRCSRQLASGAGGPAPRLGAAVVAGQQRDLLPPALGQVGGRGGQVGSARRVRVCTTSSACRGSVSARQASSKVASSTACSAARSTRSRSGLLSLRIATSSLCASASPSSGRSSASRALRAAPRARVGSAARTSASRRAWRWSRRRRRAARARRGRPRHRARRARTGWPCRRTGSPARAAARARRSAPGRPDAPP
jgi:hypothetical protein